MKTLRSIRLAAVSLLMGVPALCGGCYTSIAATEVTNHPNADGLHYFLPAPYLILEESAGNHWDARLELGVDRSHEYTVQPKAIFASSNADIAFNTDGTLKSFKLTQDSTTVPEAMISGLKDIGTKVIDQQLTATSPTKSPTTPKHSEGGSNPPLHAYVYRIDGTKLVSAHEPCSEVSLVPSSPSGAAPVNAATPSVLLNNDHSAYIIALPANQPATQDDINKLKFYAGRPRTEVDAAQEQQLRTKAGVQNGNIALPVAAMKEKDVQAFSIGDGDKVPLPTP